MKKASVFALLVLALLVLDMAALVFVNATNGSELKATTITMAVLSGSANEVSGTAASVKTTTEKVSFSNDVNDYDVEGRLRLLEIRSQKEGAAIQQQIEDVRLDTESERLSGNDIQSIEDEIARLGRASEQSKATAATLPCPY